MGIGTLGVGSGLDLESTLSQLMAVEKQPLQTLQYQQQSYQTKLSAYSTVKSAISNFQGAVSSLKDIKQYQKTNAGSTNTDIATVSATTKAANGSYSLKVDQLAQSQRLATLGVADRKESLGKGKIEISFGQYIGLNDDGSEATEFKETSGSKKFIEIDESNNTIEGIRDAINAANIGVTAAIINDGSDSPYRLTLTNTATGEKQAMQIKVTNLEGQAEDDEGLAKLGDLLTYDPSEKDTSKMVQTQAAQNAEFTLDGIKISKASNSVSDAIEGVTIKLLKADPDETSTLSISRDQSAAKTAVDSLVKAYNDLNSTLANMTKYDSESKTGSVLTGDTAVRSAQMQLKSLLNISISGGVQGYRMLSDVGITVDKNGTLQVDSSKLGTALENNFDAFVAMFAEGGLSTNDDISLESAASYAQTGTFDVEVTHKATKGALEFQLGSKGLDYSSLEAERTMQITIDGLSKSITLSKKKYTDKKELASEIQSQINSAFKDTDGKANVEYDEKADKFTITSAVYGSDSSIKLSETGGLFDNKNEIAGTDVEGTINGQAATGKGQMLSGASGTGAHGIKLKVTGDNEDGGDTSIKGTISFTKGFSYQFTQVADSMLDSNSAIQSSIDGMNASIKQVQTRYTEMSKRMETVEERLRTQFTNLDVLLAKLSSTSSYLSTQLSSLASLYSKDK